MIRRFSVTIGGRIAAALIQVAIFAVIARELEVARFGVFAATASLAVGVVAFTDLGMGARILRGTSTRDARAGLTTFALVRCAMLLLFPLAALGIAAGLSLGPVFLIVATTVFASGEATGDLAVALLQGEKRSVAAVAVLLSRRLFMLAAIMLIPGEDRVSIALILSGSVGVGTFLALSLRRRARPKRLTVLIRENFGIMLTGGATSVSLFDAAVVGISVGPHVAGLYGSATRLFNPINLAVSTMIQVFVPELASAPTPESRLLAFRRVRTVIIAIASVIAMSSLLAPLMVTTLYGERFAAAAPIAIAVFLSASLSAVAQAYMAWYYATSMPQSVPAGMWGATVLGLVAVGGFAAVFGVVGAAVGLLILHAGAAVAIILPWHIGSRGIRLT